MARTLAPRLLPEAERATRDVTDLAIVCVGSVWKSWPLLADAFTAAATAPHPVTGRRVVSFRLLRLTASSGVGAAWKAASLTGVSLPIDFAANTEVLATGGC
jgi:hypothetical protein